jgi:hypothetical protein
LSKADLAREGATGVRFTDHLENGRHRGDIGGAHGIAVHRRSVERRLGQICGDVLGQDAVGGGEEVDALGAERRCAIEDAPQRLVDGKQRHLTCLSWADIRRSGRPPCG